MAAVSLPNGARSFPPDLLEQLEQFKTVYVWCDDGASCICTFVLASKYFCTITQAAPAVQEQCMCGATTVLAAFVLSH